MADFEASSQLLRDNVKWRGGMSVEDRRQRLQSAVEQHLGPFLELGALDDLVINVVPPLEGQRQHMVQLSGIPDPPEGPVTLSQAKERIIAWARTRPAALQPGEAPAGRAVEDLLDRLRAMVAESILNPASRQLLTLIRDMQAAVARPGQEVPAKLASLHQLLQRVETKLLFHGAGCIAAPFGPSKAGKSHLLSQLVGGLVTHMPYDLLPPQHSGHVMDRAGFTYIRSELRNVPQEVLEETAADRTVTINLPASYLQADPEEDGILSVTLERQRNAELLGEYQRTGKLDGEYMSWLASQTGMPTTQIPYALAWGDTHQVVLSVATREEVVEVLLEVQRLADMLLQQAAGDASKARKKGAGSRRVAALLQDLQTDGLDALEQHLLAGETHEEVKEGLLSATGRYADLCGRSLQWDGDRPQLDKQLLRMKPEVEEFLAKFGGRFINCSSWPGPPSDDSCAGDAGVNPWQLPRQGLAHAADAFMCGVLRVVQGCAKEGVRRLCLPALLQAGIPEALLTAEWGKAPPMCALLRSACRFCPSEALAAGLMLLEIPGCGVHNAQHNAHAREALSRRITHPVCLFSLELDKTMLADMQRNYLTHALIDILQAAASRQQEEQGEPYSPRLHLAEQLAAQRREPLLVSCLEATGICFSDGAAPTPLSLGAVAEHLGVLVDRESTMQQQASRLFETRHFGVLLTNIDRLLEEGRSIAACIKWLRAFARTGRAPADEDVEEDEEEDEGEEAGSEGGGDSSDDDDDGDEGGDRRMRAIIKHVARAAVRAAGPKQDKLGSKLRRRNAEAALHRLLRPPVMTVYPSLVFSNAVNPGHAATLEAEGVDVDAALQHISSGMAQLVGHLTSATPGQLQEVLEELLTGLEQHLLALGSEVRGMERWRIPRAYAARKLRQGPGPNPREAGEGMWRDVRVAIDAFCSSTATAVPTGGGGQSPLTRVVLRQRLNQLVEQWGKRAVERLETGQIAAEVNRMGKALREDCAEARQRLNRFNKALGMQRSTVGRDPQFDIMSLLRDEVLDSQQEGAQLLAELLREVEHFALDTLAKELVQRLLRDFENSQRPPCFLTPAVRAALTSQLLEAARAQLQDAVNKFNVVGLNGRVLTAQEVDRHVTQVLEDALIELFAEARDAAVEAAGGGNGQAAPGASPSGGKKRLRGTTRNPGEQVEAMLEVVEAGVADVVKQVTDQLADCLWGTISRGVGAFGDALGWGPSLRRKNTQRQMLLLTQHYNELLRKLRNITAGSDRTRKGSMRKQLRMWQGKLLSSATLLQQQSAVDQRLLARLASSSVDASFSRGAQGITTQQAANLLQALGKAADASAQRAPLAANKHAAAAWQQRGRQPAAGPREDQEEEEDWEPSSRARLVSVLDQQGLQVTATLGNGQCLANSLLTVLHGHSLPPDVLQHLATRLVLAALGRLQELYYRDAGWRDQIEAAVTAGGFVSFQEYIDAYVADPHTWADHLLLQGMVEELGIAVMVYTSTASGVDAMPVWPTTVDDWTAANLTPYVIAYGEPAPGMGHYEAVLPTPAARQQQQQQEEEEEVDDDVVPGLEADETEEEPAEQPAAMEAEADKAAAERPAAAAAAAEAGGEAPEGSVGASSPTKAADAAPVSAAEPPPQMQGPLPGAGAQSWAHTLIRAFMPAPRSVVNRPASAIASTSQVAATGPAQQLPAATPSGALPGAAPRDPRLRPNASGWAPLERRGSMSMGSTAPALGGVNRCTPGTPDHHNKVIVVLHESLLLCAANELAALENHMFGAPDVATGLCRPLFQQLEWVRPWEGNPHQPNDQEAALLPLLEVWPQTRCIPQGRRGIRAQEWAIALGNHQQSQAAATVFFARDLLVKEHREGRRDTLVLLVVNSNGTPLLHKNQGQYLHLQQEEPPSGEFVVQVATLPQALQLLQADLGVTAAVRQAAAAAVTYKLKAPVRVSTTDGDQLLPHYLKVLD